jgi:hypothetical protein
MTQKERSRKWYLANRGIAIQRAKDWSEANPEKRAQIKERWLENTTPEERREYLNKWKEAHPEKREEHARMGYHRKRKYGITSEEFERMFFEQKGRCAVCSKEVERPPHVDHDHVSGKNRQLLCANCNWILGYAHDDESILQAAIQYLRKHK